MKIIIVASNYFPEMCGYSTRLHGIIQALLEEGHHITLIVPQRSASAKLLEKPTPLLRIVRYPHFRVWDSYHLFVTCLNEMKADNYDVLFGHSPMKNALVAYLTNGFTKSLPFFLIVHYSPRSMESAHMTFFQSLWKIPDIFIMRKATKIVSISHGLKNQMVQCGIPHEKIFLLPNGVDGHMFSPTPKDALIMEKYGLNNKKILLFVGKFQPWENFRQMIEIFQRVHENIPESVLLLVGDGPERSSIEHLITNKGIADRVTITGYVPFEEIPKFYACCDIFVMCRSPSDMIMENTTPIKPVEAMAMEKVVVSTNVGGMREIIENTKTGYLLEPATNIIADTIVTLLKDDKKRIEIGCNARKYVLENLEWSSIIRKFNQELLKYDTNTRYLPKNRNSSRKD